MLCVETIAEFDEWRRRLDAVTRARIAARLTKLAAGLWGDHKAVAGGRGLVELREHFGAGMRIYVLPRDARVVVVLAGGTKRGQQRDIERAIALVDQIKE